MTKISLCCYRSFLGTLFFIGQRNNEGCGVRSQPTTIGRQSHIVIGLKRHFGCRRRAVSAWNIRSVGVREPEAESTQESSRTKSQGISVLLIEWCCPPVLQYVKWPALGHNHLAGADLSSTDDLSWFARGRFCRSYWYNPKLNFTMTQFAFYSCVNPNIIR